MATDQRPPGDEVASVAGRGREQGPYDESLHVPLRWWALATMFLASLLLAFLVAMPVAAAVLITSVVAALNVLVFWSFGSARIVVTDGMLQAGRAHIPVALLANAEPLGQEDTRRVAGVDADARAYLVLRPYIPRSVRVRVVDPADPTPYWLLSTRHPDRLAAAVNAAVAAARDSR